MRDPTLMPPGPVELAAGASYAERRSSTGTESGSSRLASWRFLYIKCMAIMNIVLEKVVSRFGLDRSQIFAQTFLSKFVFTINYCISLSVSELLLLESKCDII
jgi:hypothetical protein